MLTLVGPGNPFGGPTQVSINQATELRSQGHEVVIVAAQPRASLRGAWKSRDVVAFDSRQLLPRAGFSGIVSFGLYRHLWKHVRDYDIVHIHMSRDLVTLPAALIARMRGVPYVVQTHGMIDTSERRSAQVLDTIATRRAVSGAARVFVLTPGEADEIKALMGKRHVVSELLQNGIEVNPVSATRDLAQGSPEVLFCSRLHSRKRPAAFVRTAIDLLDAGVEARFVLAGPDEGELPSVRQLLALASDPGGISFEGPLEPDQVADRLARSSLLVLPSVDEPFPMIVLEALAAARPVVITESCGLAEFVRQNKCGLVVSPDDRRDLTSAVRKLILDPELARSMGIRGVSAIKDHLSIEQVVGQLVTAYSSSIAVT